MPARSAAPRTMPRERRRAALGIAVVATAAGVAGFVASSNEAFSAHLGLPLWHILHFNRLCATATVAVGALAAIGAAGGRRALVVAAGCVFAAAWGLTLVQTGRATNWLGGRGDTMAFFMAVAVGLLLIALVPIEGSPARYDPESAPSEPGDASR